MKKKMPTREFWEVLATGNVLALLYPIGLLHRADSTDETLFATIVLVGFVFVLAVVDALSIVVADVVGTSKR